MIFNILFCTLLTLLLLKLLFPISKKFLIDRPNKRSSHEKPTPTSGGLVFVIIALISAIFFKSFFPIYSLPLIIVSLIDDLRHVKKSIRLITHTFTTTMIYFNSNLFKSLFQNTYESHGLISLSLISLLLIFIGVSIINFANFIDGIDGLLAINLLAIFTTFSIFFNPNFLPFVGILIGFLFWNWHPAKIFMGDIGSTFLGAILICIIFNFATLETALSYLILTTPIFADAFFTIIFRLKAKQNIFLPHKLHLFQRLNSAGWSQDKISLTYFIFTTILCVTFLKGNLTVLIFVTISEIIAGFIINNRFAKPFN